MDGSQHDLNRSAEVARADLHCHSSASQESRLGVQRAVGLPECATPPGEVYELAKRRGMDFVTITDHDTIDGVLGIADRPGVFISEERRGDALARGAQGSAAKWAHAAIALAARTLGAGGSAAVHSDPDPGTVLAMAGRLLSEADAREGADGGELRPQDAHGLLRAWLAAMELDHLDARGLIAHMQAEGFSHADLHRRARRLHERGLRSALAAALPAASGEADLGEAAASLFAACTAAIPYAPAAAFLANERAKLRSLGEDAVRRPGRRSLGAEAEEPPKVAILADGIAATHGVSRTIQEIRARGVPGFEIEVLGTDPDVDRRLAAVAEIDVPFYPGLRVGVPSLPTAVQTLTEGGYEAVHVCSPGPAGAVGALLSRALRLPLIGSYHTELVDYASRRSGRPELAAAMASAVGALYRACDVVLSPSPAADAALSALGVHEQRVSRWDRGVDGTRFSPDMRREHHLPGEIPVLYAGRITREKGVELLVEAFLRARALEPRLHLVLAGGGPEQAFLAARLGSGASFLGWLAGEELARAYASAEVLIFPSATDTFGQVILEAQASGLPVVALARGGPLSLIEQRVSGILCEPDPQAIAATLLEVIGSPLLRRQLAAGGLRSVAERTWERALGRLADGYARALGAAVGTVPDEDGVARAA